MTATERWEAYKICKERGHAPSGRMTASVRPSQVCKYCGTYYRHEVTVVEGNVPKEPTAEPGT